VTIVGGGMITHDQILPSIAHLRRLGEVGRIVVAARHTTPLRALQASPDLQGAFPDLEFTPFPPLSEPSDRSFHDAGATVIARQEARQIVIVAVPDAAHYGLVMEALRADQHVICVKPLVQRHEQALEIAALARERGLFVGVEYHKRLDRRALVAKRHYAEGRFGAFVMGEARLHEPYGYRHSNFQNWFTPDQADPFTYVGCHYVDLVQFITGLRPSAVSVEAVRRRFPNGNEGYLWSSARVRYANDALLTVTNALGYPDEAAGSNDQGLVMYCEGPAGTGMIHHDDHERGVRYSYIDAAGGARYRYVSPDYFRLVPWGGPGLRPVGYGYDSIAALVAAVRDVEAAGAGVDEAVGLQRRREKLAEIDEAGLVATAGNSADNERVIEAARASLAAAGATVRIPS
jgi:predicted dehydrogenase